MPFSAVYRRRCYTCGWIGCGKWGRTRKVGDVANARLEVHVAVGEPHRDWVRHEVARHVDIALADIQRPVLLRANKKNSYILIVYKRESS